MQQLRDFEILLLRCLDYSSSEVSGWADLILFSIKVSSSRFIKVSVCWVSWMVGSSTSRK